jgi:hypothetical protein
MKQKKERLAVQAESGFSGPAAVIHLTDQPHRNVLHENTIVGN